MKENADVIALRFWNQFVEQMVKHIQTPARLNLLKRFAIIIFLYQKLKEPLQKIGWFPKFERFLILKKWKWVPSPSPWCSMYILHFWHCKNLHWGYSEKEFIYYREWNAKANVHAGGVLVITLKRMSPTKRSTTKYCWQRKLINWQIKLKQTWFKKAPFVHKK